MTLLNIDCNFLQVVHRFWERNDIKGAIGAMEKMADHSVSILHSTVSLEPVFVLVF